MTAPPSQPRELKPYPSADEPILSKDYFRIRDFEYVQPLYDFAFLLEIDALAREQDVPKYRTFSLWRAGYSLDGYSTSIDRWLDGTCADDQLDYVPSSRIREYLVQIQKKGTISDLRDYRHQRFQRALRLRSVRGLGPKQIALSISSAVPPQEWMDQVAINLSLQRDRIADLSSGRNIGPWQTAHVVPPLLRFLHAMEKAAKQSFLWKISGVADPFEAITSVVIVSARTAWDILEPAIKKALRFERFFQREPRPEVDGIAIRHQMGWGFTLTGCSDDSDGMPVSELAHKLDPLCSDLPISLASDLHLHTAWSDGSASVNTMAKAIVASGLKYFAVTDHSRSSKLQGGLTPLLWLRQANALALASPVCPVLHGIEVDILKEGALDLPNALLKAADLVVASVHSNWSEDARENTDRLVRAIESGCVDILAHPTSAVIGKPGVPDYLRPPATILWNEVFTKCATWHVALEMNCFPSRLDLPLHLLARAIEAGCAISFGSDAHARTHLINLRFAEAALRRLSPSVVLNKLSFFELQEWITQSRVTRSGLVRSTQPTLQAEFRFEPRSNSSRDYRPIAASICPPERIPGGSRIVGIDLTAGVNLTGLAVLDDFMVKTGSLSTDEEILAYIQQHQPAIVSIDSPLGIPGGGEEKSEKAGIVRVAEYDLASVGIPAYPALIDSMEKLTFRGMRLRRAIQQFPKPPQVIESYPGAAQDILCIPRKQKGLDLLREGLRRLGLHGPGLDTKSHDEMDAITSAIVGRYFEAGLFEPMGVPEEAQLIVPKLSPLIFDQNPVICLAGKTAAGKSVVARYLSIFYGFHWIRTRDLIRELLLDDLTLPPSKRLYHRPVDPTRITEKDLREFGIVILDDYKQAPQRRKLAETIARCNTPIVVDSIRDLSEIEDARRGRRITIWFVDCKESIIGMRLQQRTKFGQQSEPTASPVDRTAPIIQAQADKSIPNSATLEDLRWRIDDALFKNLAIHQHPIKAGGAIAGAPARI